MVFCFSIFWGFVGFTNNITKFSFRLGKHLSNIWNLVLLCLMWCIWRECNRRTFEDVDGLED